MGNLYAPNGNRIIGTAETIPGIAVILEGSVERRNGGRYSFNYNGTDIDWDAQETRYDSIRQLPIYVDEDGEEWPENVLVFREEADE